jgi:triosephosphate isomerase
MKPLIVANWKCNPLALQEAKRLFNTVKNGLKKVRNAEVVICSPFTFLSFFSSSKNVKLGAQNCFWEKSGSFTGEISPWMLNDLGCDYVILGHSERRIVFDETDEMVNKKLKAAISVKLRAILCIGETEREREEGKTQEVLKSQIEKGLKDVSKGEIEKINIAYEPVWAIGTGKPCDVEEAQKIALLIRKMINQRYSPSVAKNLRVLYGGSVNSENARPYIKEANLNGFIIGGASLKPKEFIKIVKEI